MHAFIYLIQAILELIKLLEDRIHHLKKKKKRGGFQNFTMLSHKVGELLAEV